MAWLVASLLRLREGQTHTIALALMVVATAFAAVAAPRFMNTVENDLLQSTLETAHADLRDIAFIEEWRIRPGHDEPFDFVDVALAHFSGDVPAGLSAVLERPLRVVDSPLWTIVGGIPAETSVRFRFQEEVDSQIRLAAGRLPTGQTNEVPWPDEPPPEDPTKARPPIVIFEVAMTAASAEQLGLAIGDRLLLDLDRSDPLTARQVFITVRYDNRNDARIGIELAGIIEILDPAAPYWFDDPALERPIERSLGGDARVQDVTVLVDASVYGAYMDATEEARVPLRYTWRLALDRPHLTGSHVEGLLTDLRRLETVFQSAGTPLPLENSPTLRTGLLRLLAGYTAGWRAVAAVLTVVMIGAAAIALAALALTIVLVVQRRRITVGVYRRRGASSGQVIGTAALEGLVVAIPATAVGALIAVSVFPVGSTTIAVAVSALVVTTCTVLLVGAMWSAAAGAERPTTRRAVGRFGVQPRRIAAELAVVVIAAVGAYLARERGLAVTSTVTDAGGLDPLAAATPALVGVAAGVVAYRVFPMPVRLFAWFAARVRGLVPGLAMRRLARGSSGGSVLVVLLASAAIATFSSSALLYVDRSADAAAAVEVGAPYRIDASVGRLAATFDPATLPRVEASALAFVGPGSLVNGARIGVMAVDPVGLAAVVPESETGGIPPEFVAAPEKPLPVLVSRSLLESPHNVEVGKTFTMVVAGFGATYRAVGTRESFPTMGDEEHFVIVSRDQLVVALPAARLSPNRALLDAPGVEASDLRAALAGADPGAVLLGRDERAAEIREAPSATALTRGIAAATIIAALFAAAAVTAALALVGAAHAAEVAQLRALGLDRRQAASLLIVEQAPTVGLGFVGGAALGAGLFVLLQPGLSLEGIVGGGAVAPLILDPLHLVAILAGVVAIVIAGLGVAVIIQNRTLPADSVRQAGEQ